MNFAASIATVALVLHVLSSTCSAQPRERHWTVRINGSVQYGDVALDSLARDTLYASNASATHAIPIATIASMVRHRPNRVRVATLVGAGLGLAFGIYDSNTGGSGHPDLGAYLTTPIGAVVGLIIGAALSEDREITFDEPSMEKRTSKIDELIAKDLLR